ncbi:MAG: globin domain-containing protein [Pirellulaceae bacterium]
MTTEIGTMDIHDSLQQILEESKEPLAGRFYRVFFERHPEMQRYFEGVNLQFQGVMLTMALQLVAQHYENPKPAIEDYLKLLGHKHCSRGIPSDAYPTFQETLLSALAEFHEGSWDSQLEEQWRSALRGAIQTMIKGHSPGAMSY